MKLRHAIVAAICGGVLVFAAAPGAQAHVARNTSDNAVPAFGNVFMIIGENTTFSQVTKNTAPYVINTLEPKSAHLTTYFAVTHNSLANYVGLMSGQYTHCEQVDKQPIDCHQGVDNLFKELDKAGISWTEWNESMPQPCDLNNTGSDRDLNKYRVKHVPTLYFGSVEGAGHKWSATDLSNECLHRVIPAGTTGPNDTSKLDAALASGDMSRFNLIIPNMCEDSHDACQPRGKGDGRVRAFDQFLQREVQKIEASPAFTSNSAILVTWDESDAEGIHGDPLYGGGQVQWILDSPLVQPGGYSGLSNHYSTLQMLEDGFGVPHIAGAVDASPIPVTWK
jgi:phosphatidylinositol-3-phosphatase